MSVDPPKPINGRQFSDSRHRQIVNRLEDAKIGGLITDFFVSWIGANGNLNPVVRAWRNPEVPEIRIRDYISRSLAGVINPSDLTIIDGDRTTA